MDKLGNHIFGMIKSLGQLSSSPRQGSDADSDDDSSDEVECN